MDIKKLNRVNRIAKKLKALDTEIERINKFAMLCLDNKQISLQMKAEVKKPKTKEDLFDEDGSLKLNYPSPHNDIQDALRNMQQHWLDKYNGHASGGFYIKKKTELENDILNMEIPEGLTLHILGFLLAEKQELKEKLIKTLENYGVKYEK